MVEVRVFNVAEEGRVSADHVFDDSNMTVMEQVSLVGLFAGLLQLCHCASGQRDRADLGRNEVQFSRHVPVCVCRNFTCVQPVDELDEHGTVTRLEVEWIASMSGLRFGTVMEKQRARNMERLRHALLGSDLDSLLVVTAQMTVWYGSAVA